MMDVVSTKIKLHAYEETTSMNRLNKHCKMQYVRTRGGTRYEKLGGRKISGVMRRKNFSSCPPTIPVCRAHLLGHMPLLSPTLRPCML